MGSVLTPDYFIGRNGLMLLILLDLRRTIPISHYQMYFSQCTPIMIALLLGSSLIQQRVGLRTWSSTRCDFDGQAEAAC